MQRESTDVNNLLDPDAINEMEERRIEALDEAGIDEQHVLSQAHDDMNSWNSYFQENITRGKDDMNFCVRDQWTAVERSEFTRLFKPAMTFNKLAGDVKKITAEQRKNKPDLMVRSLTGKASQEQLDLRADLIRSISYRNENDLVYQTAFRSALMMGFGAFQVRLDYKNPMTFDKDIFYDIIPDPTMCSWDPRAMMPHKGDGNYCARRYIYSRDEFFATYPYVTNPISYQDPQSLLDFQWVTKDTIVVCEYYMKEWFPLKLLKLSNGMSVTEAQWEDAQEVHKQQKELVQGSIVSKIIERGIPKIVMERQTQDYKIMNYKMTRGLIIDFAEWPSRQLPMPFVDGDSQWIEGRQYTKSFIHEARDAQKCVNFFNSEIAAEVKNRRREQWMATPDNIAGYEQQWRNPETQLGALIAKPDPKTGMMPQKMPAWELAQGLMLNAQRASQDMREILGTSEAENMQAKDISGKARRERKLETSMSSYLWFDNLNQAVAQGGRITNDLLTHVVGEDERHFVITKKDGRSQSIIMNQQQKDGSVKNILEEGEFDVEIDTGPSFAVQKEVALEFLAQTLQVAPQNFNLIADLWAKNLDVQFMPQISERFESLVPPQILAKEKGEEPPPPQPNPQEEMMKAELEDKKQALMERAEELDIRKQKHKLEEYELMLKAKELQDKAQQSGISARLDMAKTDMDYTSKMAKLLADVHVAHNANSATGSASQSKD